MFKKILLILAVVLVGFLVYVQTRPDDFRISRTATFAAPPAALFAQVNDFHKWNDWSPWAKLDPNAKNTFEGPGEGVGAAFSWAGNNEVGEGKMTIEESRPTDLIRMKLEFIKPFTATNATEFTFRPEGDKTVMSWTMSGKNNFVGKAMSCFMDCDKMIGSKFEDGFANLRAIVEAKPAPAT